MDTRREKKMVLYTLAIFFIFAYVSMYSINYIIDKSLISSNTTVEINNNKNNNITDNGDNNNAGGNTSSGNKNSGNNGESGSKENDVVIDASSIFKVLQGEDNWKELKEIDVFKNKYFNDQAIIAPGTDGKYNFIVSNESEDKFGYSITFSDENVYNINLKYKLLRNGAYIAGNEDKWISSNEMSISDLVINANSKDLYTIEWKWLDADNDTQIGETDGASYKMFVEVNAQQID